jgi:addiction module RelB/DinJ family antitoxin
MLQFCATAGSAVLRFANPAVVLTMAGLGAILKQGGDFMTNTTIQIRTDAEVKAAADSIFARLGITMSDGINIFLRQVQIHQGFPFEVRLRQPPAAESDGQTGNTLRSKQGAFPAPPPPRGRFG